MKIIIFGASGRTGREIIARAAAQGHVVTAFVRSVDALPRSSELRVIQGEVGDSRAVSDAIGGQQAVFSALGARALDQKAMILYRAVPNILAGMRQNEVNRLIVLGAASPGGAGKYQNGLAKLVLWIGGRTFLRHPFADQAAQERLLAASDVDYTIVRPPRLTDDAYTGKYRVLPDALPSGGLRISRADVADFMLQQLTDPRFHRQGPYIAD